MLALFVAGLLLLVLIPTAHEVIGTSIFRHEAHTFSVPPAPPPLTGHLPPGCDELRHSHETDALRWRLPLGDAAFRDICSGTPVVGARGGCFRLHKQRVKCLPTFLVVGFTKAGTSVFFQYASQHNLVRAARLKEPAYLGSDIEAAVLNSSDANAATATDAVIADAADAAGGFHLQMGRRDGTESRPPAKTLRWYMSLFPSCASCERGEATPGYAWRDYAAVAAAQARLLLGGSAKLVMLVREPIERAASHYVYFREKRRAFRVASLSNVLHSALDEFERCAAQLGGWQHTCTYRSGRRAAEIAHAAIQRIRPELWRLKNKANYELLQAGLYSEHLITWRAQFSAASILVLDSSVLLSTPLRVMRRFERHLGLPHFGDYELSREHALASPRFGGPKPGVAAGDALARHVDAALRARLETFFAPFNRKLRRDTGIRWEYHSASNRTR
jgi:hypothetical protein